MNPSFTNALINETSPYLLQHAHNPINWEAWSSETLQKAKKENTLLLISIGYAACHWCHVMEHECFEDEEVAKVMNENFINIKVDREERPDVDHIYMDALQMMTGSGGWPLNIVALPDGRPFWGATYVQKENWTKILVQLSQLYQNDPEKINEYAEKLAKGIKAINLVDNNDTPDIITIQTIESKVKDWSKYFDHKMGGYNRAPKFMMPVNLNFLLHYATLRQDEAILAYVNTTLTKMAWGGIFDHVGGGFSRYSVDTKWHVPHFEKMLYDNGQLVSLYAQAYAATKNGLYKKIVERTIEFLKRELMNENYGFYSSLDADSIDESGELEEGAYYVWTENELVSLLGERFEIFKDYFNVDTYGHWEHRNYVLIRNAAEDDIAQRHGISVEKLNEIITNALEVLQKVREKRNRPRLDDKILTSWNGLLLKGLTDAYRYFENSEYLQLALKNADFMLENLYKKDGGLFHNHKNGKSTINGYLEDYASVIEAFMGLYEVTFDEKWLRRTKVLTEYCFDNFFDAQNGMFYFTSKKDDFIIRRTVETTDNVVAASNSIMAKNLFKLSRFFPDTNYEAVAVQQLKNVQGNFENSVQSYANWLQLALYMTHPFYEIAIVGNEFEEKANEISRRYLPGTILAATEKESEIAILRNRFSKDNTFIYVCKNGSCKLPVTQTEEVLAQFDRPGTD